MAYTIAGIDVHKRLLAVVVADLTADGEYGFERRQFGSTPAQRGLLADWLSAHEVDEVVTLKQRVLRRPQGPLFMGVLRLNSLRPTWPLSENPGLARSGPSTPNHRMEPRR